MKQFKISDYQLALAERWSSFTGNKYTYSDPTRNKIIGALGEMCFESQYPNSKRISQIDTQADFIYYDLNINGDRIDIKTTALKKDPKDYYHIHIDGHQKNYDVDYYYFYFYNEETKTLFDLGILGKNVFFDNATLYPVGSLLPYAKIPLKGDAYCLKIENLKKIQNDKKNG